MNLRVSNIPQGGAGSLGNRTAGQWWIHVGHFKPVQSQIAQVTFATRRAGRLLTSSMPVSNSAFPAMRRADYRKVFIPLKVQRTDDVKRTIGFDRSQTSATSGGETN